MPQSRSRETVQGPKAASLAPTQKTALYLPFLRLALFDPFLFLALTMLSPPFAPCHTTLLVPSLSQLPSTYDPVPTPLSSRLQLSILSYALHLHLLTNGLFTHFLFLKSSPSDLNAHLDRTVTGSLRTCASAVSRKPGPTQPGVTCGHQASTAGYVPRSASLNSPVKNLFATKPEELSSYQTTPKALQFRM